MVCGLNKQIELVWAQTQQKPRSIHKQIPLLKDIRYGFENFWVLNQQTDDPKPKN